ncbi:MAG TPA: hypothetical protein VF210_18200 [Pseudomonadales bacterium]
MAKPRRPRYRARLAWLVPALFAACGAAAPAGGEDAPTGELLLAAPPDGWQEQGAMQTPMLRMAEYGPPDAGEQRLERLTFEAQSGDPLPDPIEFVRGVSRDLAERCDGFEDSNISSGYENGYPTSVRLMICTKFKDAELGQVVMAKAIQGNERFYVITRRLRAPPAEGGASLLTAQEMAEWSAHLGGIRVCDTRDAKHPCPSPARGEPAEP